MRNIFVQAVFYERGASSVLSAGRNCEVAWPVMSFRALLTASAFATWRGRLDRI